MVYLITFGDRKYCKIGYAKNVKNRISNMQTGLPYEIEIIAIARGSVKVEQAIHHRFKDLRVRGEWFSFDERIAKFFENKCIIKELNDKIEAEEERKRLEIERIEKEYEEARNIFENCDFSSHLHLYNASEAQELEFIEHEAEIEKCTKVEIKPKNSIVYKIKELFFKKIKE